jgi:hypothetical protein
MVALAVQRPKATAKVTAKMVASLERLMDLRWASWGEGDVLMENS